MLCRVLLYWGIRWRKYTCYWKEWEWEWKSYKCIYMYNYLIYYERITRPNKPIDSFPSIIFIEYKRPEYFCSFLSYFILSEKTTRHEFNSTLNETSQWIFYEKKKFHHFCCLLFISFHENTVYHFLYYIFFLYIIQPSCG
jgi:hypothetical protein